MKDNSELPESYKDIKLDKQQMLTFESYSKFLKDEMDIDFTIDDCKRDIYNDKLKEQERRRALGDEEYRKIKRWERDITNEYFELVMTNEAGSISYSEYKEEGIKRRKLWEDTDKKNENIEKE